MLNLDISNAISEDKSGPLPNLNRKTTKASQLTALHQVCEYAVKLWKTKTDEDRKLDKKIEALASKNSDVIHYATPLLAETTLQKYKVNTQPSAFKLD